MTKHVRGDPLSKRASFYRYGLVMFVAAVLPAALSVPASAARAPVRLTPAQIQAIAAKAASRARNLTTPAAPNGFPGNGSQRAAPGRAGMAPADSGAGSNDVPASAFALWVNDPNGPVSNWNDLIFEGYQQDMVPNIANGVVYPDETLTATAIVFNEDNTCPLYGSGPLQPCPNAI